MRIRCRPTAFLCLASAARLVWASGPAGIKLDGTLGPSAAALAGPMYSITQNLGKLSGGNLFFSFQYFNVASGETALFTTSSAGINNVISRVTGGYASTIDGTIALQAASGAPNFFLINPSGVTFTSNAVIDVPAAFYVSTANYLKFNDGNFYVDPTKMSTLSAAAPEAFGFLGTTRAPVNVMGANLSAGVNGAGDFQIVAGDVTIDGGGTLVGIQNTTGNIGVTAVGSASAEVPLSGPFAATDGTVTIRNGGLLLTQGQGSTNGGAIEVNAGSLLIDGLGLAINGAQFQQTGINTLTDSLGEGTDAAGPITVTVGGDVSIVNGGAIQSGTFGPGNAGNVSISAQSLTIDGENFTGAFAGIGNATESSGSAGDTVVNITGTVSIVNGGAIGSQNFGSGNAGNISLSANSLTIDGGSFLGFTGIVSAFPAGNVMINVADNVSISNGGAIVSFSVGSGSAGALSVTAGSVAIDGGGMENLFTGIIRQGGSGSTGAVVTTTGALTITDGGFIFSGTLGSGNAGALSVTAGSIAIDGGTGMVPGGIVSGANASIVSTGEIGFGNAGALTVATTGALTVTNGGFISSSTNESGSAGALTVTTMGALTVTNRGLISSSASGSGFAGALTVATTGALTVTNGGLISSSTSGSGNAGALSVTAGSVAIDGGGTASSGTGIVGEPAGTGIVSEAAPGSTGSAGTLTVTTTGALTIANGGFITSGTSGSGNAGALSVTAGSVAIDGANSTANSTGIFSNAVQGSTGSAGSVTVNVNDTAYLLNGGVISSAAENGSGGQPGTIAISAGTLILGTGGVVTIENDATVSNPSVINPTQINTQAQNIQMNGGLITAASTGNVAASGIDISYNSALRMDPSTISTSAVDGNGGPITITGQGPLFINHSNITTTVTGTTQGNGGDITINVPVIVLDSGAIQANTAAPKASGGNVTIDAGAIIPSFESIVLGGNLQNFDPTMSGFNLIQAAAPDGVSGALNVTVPTLDLGNALLGLTGRPSAPAALGRGLCGSSHGSSLAISGRGGVAPTAYDPLWIDPEQAWREASIGSTYSGVATANTQNIELRALFACR